MIFILFAAELIYSNLSLTVSRYALTSDKAAGAFRVVFLSDLHGREFGAGNARLLDKIAEEEPDIIALVGDIFDAVSDEEDVGRGCEFIKAATEIAPVYFCMGNHECNCLAAFPDLPQRIAEAGAKVLDAEYVDTEINGTQVRIGGYAGFYRTPQMDTADREKREEYARFFDEFEDTDRFKLLLDHIPTTWLDWEYRDTAPVDLVLSGHYHGGNARIPFIGQGLYAPYVGWFPKYTKGCYEGEEATCILSTGLAGGKGWPRFFNPPEIAVVDISGAN